MMHKDLIKSALLTLVLKSVANTFNCHRRVKRQLAQLSIKLHVGKQACQNILIILLIKVLKV